MKIYTQISMLYAAAVYLMWGVGFMLAPSDMHKILSTGPYDPATSAMFTASLLAFAVITVAFVNFLNRAFITITVVIMTFLGVTAIYQVANGHIATNFATIATLIVNCGVALFLVYVLMLEAAGAEWSTAPARSSRLSGTKKKKAATKKSKALKKKTPKKKKAVKKKKTKRRR